VQFTSQPTGGAFRAGRPVTLAAAPLIDGFGATYQWRRSGSPLADGNGLAGATTPTLTIASARTADAGSYDLLVSASCGSTLSAAATVNVICSADFNADGAVTIDDVFGFIAAFLANQVESDFTRDFRIGVQDLFDFLNAYFRGC
jgi:hypothetical protein